MKASIISALSLFSLSALSAPLATRSNSSDPVTVQLQLSEDIDGGNAVSSVLLNGPAVPLGSIFSSKTGGPVQATSIMIVNPGVEGGKTYCGVINPEGTLGFFFTSRASYIEFKLSEEEEKVPVIVEEWLVQCADEELPVEVPSKGVYVAEEY